MKYVIGIDLGTSSLKAILVNQTGDIVDTRVAEYPVLTPKFGYSEQDPKSWTDAAEYVLSELFAHNPAVINQVEGISFSGQMHSLVALDSVGEPLRNAILWNDVRTTAECQKIMADFGPEVLAQTKNIALEGFTLPKLVWLKKHEPAIFEAMSSFLLPKDYLSFYLTGERKMELSDAAGTLLLNVEKRQWAWEIAAKFELPATIFPQLVSSYQQVGTVKASLLAKWGVEQPIPVYGGGADNACAALGAGIVKPDIGLLSIGTSGVFLGFENDAKQDFQGQLHYFNHVAKDKYYSMGVTLAAGYSLSWFRQVFAKGLSYEELFAGVEAVEPGAKGLLFTPFIAGERSPYVDSQIRGSFIGMDAGHSLPDFVRSVVEGITFSLKESQQLMETYGNKKFEQLVSVGGGAKNPTWLQIQADIFDSVIVTLTSEQGPAIGAAMLASLGAGWFENEESCVATFVKYGPKYYPNQVNVDNYKKVYELYKMVYPATKKITHQLGTLRD